MFQSLSVHPHPFDALSKGGKRSIQQTATHPAYENTGHACGILSGKVAKSPMAVNS
jgi:hypothetical protein